MICWSKHPPIHSEQSGWNLYLFSRWWRLWWPLAWLPPPWRCPYSSTRTTQAPYSHLFFCQSDIFSYRYRRGFYYSKDRDNGCLWKRLRLNKFACCMHKTKWSPDATLFSAIIISGGYDLTSDQPYKTSVSVEIFVPSTGFQCYLPSLPKSRAFHTHDQWLVCGGRSDSYLDKVDLSCLTLKYGTWSISHNLTHSRWQI